MFSAALGKSSRKLRIGKSYKENHNTTDHKSEDCADYAACFDPVSGRYDPAPSDHGAERDYKDIPGAEHFIKF